MPDDTDYDTDDEEPDYKYIENYKILFGKHKGTLYKHVPDSYIRWCLENDVFKNDNVKNYCEKYRAT